MNASQSNIAELTNIAEEVGATVIEGNLRYPSPTGGWQLGEIDLNEYLAQHRDKKVALIIAVVDEDTEDDTYICGICGFTMNELGECPRCKMQNAENAKQLQQHSLFDEVRNLLGGDDET